MTTDLFSQGIDFQKVIFSAGQVVFSMRDVADSAFFIRRGSIEISMSGIRTAVLFVGDFFGEHSLGQYVHRQNSATALEETTLFRIGKEEMLKAFYTIPELREFFIANLVRQLRGLSSYLGRELLRDS